MDIKSTGTENTKKHKNALVAMSGGVDSAVAALLTLKTGYSAVGVTMDLTDYDLASNPSSYSDIQDAKAICDKLGMSHKTIKLGKEFKQHVISSFVNSYIDGETPNPCVVCNKMLKFGKLWDCAKEIDVDTIVTGHYANITRNEDGRYLLRRATALDKDQSYVLWTLTQDILSHVYFPLGTLTKTEVREIAASHGFKNASKSDSQDICFIPDGDYISYIEKFCGKSFPKGDFLDTDGNVLGRHQGIIHYTPGQRKGLGIAFGKPMYVKEKDAVTNTVILSSNEELFSNGLTAHGINLISTDRIETPMRASVKIRYNHIPCPAAVTQTGDDTVSVIFDTPQRAVARGQSLVIYDGDIVVGGGIIN